MPRNRSRSLEWGKSQRPSVNPKIGSPIDSEGGTGDIQIRQSSIGGGKLWAKLGGRWLSNILYAPNDNIIFETSRNIKLKSSSSDIILDSTSGGNIDMTASRVNIKRGHINMYSPLDEADYLEFVVTSNGAIFFTNYADTGTLGNLYVNINGSISLVAATSASMHAESGNCSLGTDSGDVVLDASTGVIQFENDNDDMAILTAAGSNTALILYEDGGASTDDYCSIATTTHGDTTISTVDAAATAAHLTLDADGDIYLDAATGVFRFYDAGDTNDSFKLAVVGGTGATTLETVSDAADGHLSIVADGDITLNSRSGVFIAEQSGTEFSAADSAYAGMILGFTNIHPGTLDRWTFSTSWESITSGGTTVFEPKITFVAPPSQNVMITVQLGSGCSGMSGTLYLGLASDTSATTLNSLYENVVLDVDETDSVNPRYSWVVSNSHSGTTLTAGTSYDYFIMVKTAAGSARINFGGAASGIQIWATALPATIYDGT